MSKSYHQCLFQYSSWIESNLDHEQKNYYKECTHVIIWYNRHWGDRIQLIFFKNETDYKFILANKSFAWRVDVHYWGCKLCHYPPNPTREWMIDFIIYAIIDIYKNGDIPHPYNKQEE
ncbi:hypothetical protein IMSAGC004_03015 [Bacteroidaceae bacterium]|nr:hypothetical protein IMSAGC004_03015 [Bacteroidaceae bacterium]